MFVRALPSPRRTAEVSSFSAHVSPRATSYPAAAIRSRAVTPAACHEFPVLCTQRVHVAKWISAMAWKFGPSARMRHAWSRRKVVLSATSGGTET